MLARRSGMYYSQGIQFQTILINMEEEKELTMNNKLKKTQQKRCRCGSIKHLRISFKDCPVGLAIRKATKSALKIITGSLVWWGYPSLDSRHIGNECFVLTEIKTTSTFEQFLQAETLNTKKNKSYYQRYDVKRLRAFHKQTMI